MVLIFDFAFSQRLKYLTSITNLIEWVIYVSALVFVFPVCACKSHFKSEAAAFSLFFAWLNLVLYFRRLVIPFFSITPHAANTRQLCYSLFNKSVKDQEWPVYLLLLLFWRIKDGPVVRALSSHQCGPDSNPGVDAICGICFLPCSGRFFSGYSGFPLPFKTDTSKFRTS